MRQIQNARAIGDAGIELAGAHDVLLVIGAGTGDVAGFPAQHAGNGPGSGQHHRRIPGCGCRHKTHDVLDAVVEAWPAVFELLEHGHNFSLHGVEVFFGDKTAIKHSATGMGHHRRRQITGRLAPCIERKQLFDLAAMQAVDVECADPRSGWLHRLGGVTLRQLRLQPGFQQMDEGAHVLDGAVTEKRHGAMGHPAQGLDLAPPDAAVTQTDAVHAQRFGNDHVVDAGLCEIAALCQIADTRETARLFIDRAGNFQRTGKVQPFFQNGLAGNHAGGQTAFHVAAAATVNFAVLDLAAKGRGGPAGAGFHHVDVAVEVYAFTIGFSLITRHHVDPRMGVAVPRRAFRTDVFDRKSALLQPFTEQVGAGFVGIAGRVDGGNADQGLCERHHLVPFRFNTFEQAVIVHTRQFM